MFLDINYLKENCKMIHYFGLGFIQLKLSESQRMHFYTKSLPPIVSEEDVHNHRYDFVSVILKGELRQDIHQLKDGETHIVEDESCKEGYSPAAGKLCSIELSSYHNYKAGSDYFINHNTLHKVSAVECITLLTRSNYKKELAQVVRPVGAPKVCPFSLKIEETELWDIVKNML